VAEGAGRQQRARALARGYVCAAAGTAAVALASSCGTAATAQTAPRSLRAPGVLGVAQIGQSLTAAPGAWSPARVSYSYAWSRCTPSGAACRTIPGATGATYLLSARDVGSTLRVSVAATDRAGRSLAPTSAPTALIARTGTLAHLEYVFNDGPVHVYDIDHGFRLVESFRLAGTDRGVRGVAVSPRTHMMFVAYGGDGGGNGSGSVLAYDLVRKRIVWSVSLKTGIDSAAVSNDGRLLYMPDGELSSDGSWYILSTANGSVLGTIRTHGPGPHDGVLSADGRILQLGDRNYPRLTIYNTATGAVQAQIGPLAGGVRPNTINGADSLSFTTATGFDGFQVSGIARAAVLYTERFAACSGPFSTCSHGISLSPNNRQLAVIDTVHKAVQLWDVHAVAAGVAPVHLATVRVDGLEGQQSGCAYDCGRDGWLQHTLDGRYIVAGDTGDVIDTGSYRIVARIGNLLNTRQFVEIDWRGGVPVASSGRQGIGRQR
jgi:DNA-binding beta-propeller fold protein YncE